MDGEIQLIKFWNSGSALGCRAVFCLREMEGGEYVQGMWWGPSKPGFLDRNEPPQKSLSGLSRHLKPLNPKPLNPKPLNPKPLNPKP